MKIDGKELSEETVKKACEAYGISFERKFEPIKIDNLTVSLFPSPVSAASTGCPIDIRITGNTDVFSLSKANEIIKALQSAIDYVESK